MIILSNEIEASLAFLIKAMIRQDMSI